MHINTFDHFQTRESLIHRLDPRVKVVVTVLFILSNVLLPDGAWIAYILSFGMLVLISRLARIELRFLVTRSFIVLPFALAAVTTTFSISGDSLFTLKIGSWVLTFTEPGVLRFASIMLRSWVSVQMAILLTATTPFPDLVHALRHLHMPHILVATISFMYRYLFVLSDEVMRLIRAREARSALRVNGTKGGGSLRWRARIAGNMAGQLFLRSYERSERIYNAMLSRGYQGEFLTLNPHHMHTKDWVLGVFALILLVITQLAARLP